MIVVDCLDVGPVRYVEPQTYCKMPLLVIHAYPTHIALRPNIIAVQRVAVTVTQHVVHLPGVLDVRVCANHIFAVPGCLILKTARAVNRYVVSLAVAEPGCLRILGIELNEAAVLRVSRITLVWGIKGLPIEGNF